VLYRASREIPESTIPAPMVQFPETKECVIEDEPMQREEQVKEEQTNVTETEIEQLRARIERLERYFKENQTS